MTIEGIPDGWELVRVGKPLVGEYYIDVTGSVYKALDTTPTVLHWHVPIIRKIEKPKQYRPFANAAEAEPFFDRRLKYKDHNEAILRICNLAHKGIEVGMSYYTYKEAYGCFECIDGTPFGIEVTE